MAVQSQKHERLDSIAMCDRAKILQQPDTAHQQTLCQLNRLAISGQCTIATEATAGCL